MQFGYLPSHTLSVSSITSLESQSYHFSNKDRDNDFTNDRRTEHQKEMISHYEHNIGNGRITEPRNKRNLVSPPNAPQLPAPQYHFRRNNVGNGVMSYTSMNNYVVDKDSTQQEESYRSLSAPTSINDHNSITSISSKSQYVNGISKANNYKNQLDINSNGLSTEKEPKNNNTWRENSKFSLFSNNLEDLTSREKEINSQFEERKELELYQERYQRESRQLQTEKLQEEEKYKQLHNYSSKTSDFSNVKDNHNHLATMENTKHHLVNPFIDQYRRPQTLQDTEKNDALMESKLLSAQHIEATEKKKKFVSGYSNGDNNNNISIHDSNTFARRVGTRRRSTEVRHLTSKKGNPSSSSVVEWMCLLNAEQSEQWTAMTHTHTMTRQGTHIKLLELLQFWLSSSATSRKIDELIHDTFTSAATPSHTANISKANNNKENVNVEEHSNTTGREEINESPSHMHHSTNDENKVESTKCEICSANQSEIGLSNNSNSKYHMLCEKYAVNVINSNNDNSESNMSSNERFHINGNDRNVKPISISKLLQKEEEKQQNLNVETRETQEKEEQEKEIVLVKSNEERELNEQSTTGKMLKSKNKIEENNTEGINIIKTMQLENELIEPTSLPYPPSSPQPPSPSRVYAELLTQQDKQKQELEKELEEIQQTFMSTPEKSERTTLANDALVDEIKATNYAENEFSHLSCVESVNNNTFDNSTKNNNNNTTTYVDVPSLLSLTKNIGDSSSNESNDKEDDAEESNKNIMNGNSSNISICEPGPSIDFTFGEEEHSTNKNNEINEDEVQGPPHKVNTQWNQPHHEETDSFVINCNNEALVEPTPSPPPPQQEHDNTLCDDASYEYIPRFYFPLGKFCSKTRILAGPQRRQCVNPHLIMPTGSSIALDAITDKSEELHTSPDKSLALQHESNNNTLTPSSALSLSSQSLMESNAVAPTLQESMLRRATTMSTLVCLNDKSVQRFIEREFIKHPVLVKLCHIKVKSNKSNSVTSNNSSMGNINNNNSNMHHPLNSTTSHHHYRTNSNSGGHSRNTEKTHLRSIEQTCSSASSSAQSNELSSSEEVNVDFNENIISGNSNNNNNNSNSVNNLNETSSGSVHSHSIKEANYKNHLIQCMQHICTHCFGVPRYFAFVILHIMSSNNWIMLIEKYTISSSNNNTNASSKLSSSVKELHSTASKVKKSKIDPNTTLNDYSIVTPHRLYLFYELYLKGKSSLRRVFDLLILSSECSKPTDEAKMNELVEFFLFQCSSHAKYDLDSMHSVHQIDNINNSNNNNSVTTWCKGTELLSVSHNTASLSTMLSPSLTSITDAPLPLPPSLQSTEPTQQHALSLSSTQTHTPTSLLHTQLPSSSSSIKEKVMPISLPRHHLECNDFAVYMSGLLEHHPGLAFLRQTPDFQPKYVHTVSYRIFYDVDRHDRHQISFSEFTSSALMDAFRQVDATDDINTVLLYFSYEHFYVLYCRFWELDLDRDMLLGPEDLSRYLPEGMMNELVVDRVFAGVGRPLTCEVPNHINYEDFIWFCLSEEDKSTCTAIRYWFRILDLDGDGVLSFYELRTFYTSTCEKIALFLPENIISFEHIIGQVLDMLRLANVDGIRLRDLLHERDAAFVALNMLTNVIKFLQFEQKDPFVNHQERLLCAPEQTPWDRFARVEYDRMAQEADE